jgi:thiamine-phosphate pyrophosphorylase
MSNGSRCLLYYITDRLAFVGGEAARQKRLLEQIAEATRCGVDYIQLREKDLPTRALEQLAHEAVQVVRASRDASAQSSTRLLINSRTDVALAVEADGVHLRGDDISPAGVRNVWTRGTPARADSSRTPLIAVSCHSPAEVTQAAANDADFAVFAPVFAKKDVPGSRPAGLALLQQACQARIPVLALGGITLQNARSSLDAGAAGIAAIRLFQENDISDVIRKLKAGVIG